MISPALVHAVIAHFKFFLDIFVAFLIATLLFAWHCKRRSHFWLRATGCLVGIRLVCLTFAYTYGGNIALESLDAAVVLALMLAGLLFCYDETVWNMLFYFGSGFMTWYITDRLFLIAASLARIHPVLRRYFVEGTIPHILLYIGSFLLVYAFSFFTVARQMHRFSGEAIPMQNSLLLFALVCILTPIFYFESQQIVNYNLFFYNLLNLGEIIFYLFMLLIQVQTLVAAKERAQLATLQTLWAEEQRQYRLTKENIDAINIKCHDLKHQIRHLREAGRVDPAYLDSLEESVNLYNSAVRTGNETLDVVLTDKRLHCATHNIQFTCMADGAKMNFMEVMDIYSLFGNMLDNAIECEMTLPAATRFIHLTVRSTNWMLVIHVENHFEGRLELRDGLPVTTKKDRANHGFGMLSIRRVVEKYGGNLVVSTEAQLFQIDIVIPVPARAGAGQAPQNHAGKEAAG